MSIAQKNSWKEEILNTAREKKKLIKEKHYPYYWTPAEFDIIFTDESESSLSERSFSFTNPQVRLRQLKREMDYAIAMYEKLKKAIEDEGLL